VSEEKRKTKNKANVLKVVELGLENRVYDEMKKPGFSAEALTRQLNAEGVKITAQSIRKFIKKSKNAQQRLAQQDLQVANKVKELTVNYTNELKDILSEVQEMKNTAREEKDLATYNQLIGRIYQGIELLAKLSGDMKPKERVDINIVYNEIQSDVESRMRNIKDDLFKNTIDVDAEIQQEDKENAEKLRQ